MTFAQAITDINQGKAQRICVPGQWRVWANAGAVKAEIFKGAKL